VSHRRTRPRAVASRGRLSPALVVSIVALIAALGGSAYAVGYEPIINAGSVNAHSVTAHHVHVLGGISAENPTAHWIYQKVPLPKNGVGDAVLTCPNHETVISGGYDQGSLYPVVVVDQPIAFNTWEVKILSSVGPGNQDATMEGYALCATIKEALVPPL
jgi:hypothetical protein